MLQSILLILVVIGAFWGYRKLGHLDAKARRRILLRSAIGAVVLLLIMAAATGRMHWLVAVIGALIPFMRGLLGIGLQFLPLWLKHKNREQPGQHQQRTGSPAPQTTMDTKEAQDVLGLKGDLARGEITAEMINDAHRRLIQKLHPDRGGNDYLAARVNLARDLLLKRIEKP
ncbi:MAG TPA: molecular chaperone DnaJ [Cellvibrio sp.]|nr:molecular chaperone DnaJ [Cellvibrio sp.]